MKTLPENYASRLEEEFQAIRRSDPTLDLLDAIRLAEERALQAQPGAGRSLELIQEGLAAAGIHDGRALLAMAEERVAQHNERLLADHASRRGRPMPTTSVAPPPADGTPLDLAEGYGAGADPRKKLHAELHDRAMRYATEHKVDYVEALRIVAAGAKKGA